MEVKLVVNDVREVLNGQGRTDHSSVTAQHGLHGLHSLSSSTLTLPFTLISHSPLPSHSPLSPLILSFHSHSLTLTPSHLVNLVALLQSVPHPPQTKVGLRHGDLKPVALHVVECLQWGKSLLKGQSRGSPINFKVTNCMSRDSIMM